MAKAKKGIVYLLTNPAMPELVKVGLVKSQTVSDLHARVGRLYNGNTSVPLHFDVYYAVRVNDESVEKTLLDAFKDERVNSRREFLRLDPETENQQGTLKKLKILLSALGRPISEEELRREKGASGIPAEEARAHDLAEQRLKKRSPFNFELVNIDEGTVLTFSKDSSITAKVVGGNIIEYDGAPMSLSRAANKILSEKFGKTSQYAGTLYWECDGEILDARRKRLEESESQEEDE